MGTPRNFSRTTLSKSLKHVWVTLMEHTKKNSSGQPRAVLSKSARKFLCRACTTSCKDLRHWCSNSQWWLERHHPVFPHCERSSPPTTMRCNSTLKRLAEIGRSCYNCSRRYL